MTQLSHSHLPPSPVTLDMGETVVGSFRNPPNQPRPSTPADRVRARRDIITCTRCELAGPCRAPIPWSGPAPNLALVVGEAPGATEDRLGIPFVGVSGQLLRNTIRQLGLDPDILTFANTVSCFPTFKPPTPKLDHLDACAPNLARTIQVVSPAHVLLVGGVALSRFRADLRISTAHGKPFVVPHPHPRPGQVAGLWCFPVVHPASILRDNSQRPSWMEDLATWLALITEPSWPTRYIPEKCLVCRAEVFRYDPDGVAWCETHHPKGMAGWQASQKRRRWLTGTTGGAVQVRIGDIDDQATASTQALDAHQYDPNHEVAKKKARKAASAEAAIESDGDT